MRRQERIPIHDHADLNSGGRVAQSTIVAVLDTGSTGGSGATIAALDDIPDVNTAGVADGDVLTYDSGTSEWIAAAPSAGSGDVATDTIWNAKGDLAGGTGSDTAARLAVGSDGQVLTADSGETTGMKWTTLGGSANAHAENEAAVLVNATSTGDAGSRADHFPGTSLDAAWASEASALGSGPTVKYSALGMRQSTNNAHHRLRAYTPSGAFRVEARMRYYLTSGQGGMGLFVRDSSTGDATGNGILAWMNNAGRFEVYSLDTGTYTQRGATLAESLGLPGGWVYIAIERDGSNNWTVQLSLDRALWIAGVSGHSKTFTVAKAGFRLHAGTGATLGSVDFFDVVS